MTPFEAAGFLPVMVVDASRGEVVLTPEHLYAAGLEPLAESDGAARQPGPGRWQSCAAILLCLGHDDPLASHRVRRLKEAHGDVPVLVWTRPEGERLALEAVAAGAVDYALSDARGHAALGRLVREAVSRHSAQRRLADRARALKAVQAPPWDWTWECSDELRLTWLSDGCLERAGLLPTSLLGKCLWDCDELRPAAGWERLRQDMAGHRPFRGVLVRYSDQEGRSRALRLAGMPTFDREGGFLGYAGTAADAPAQSEDFLCAKRACPNRVGPEAARLHASYAAEELKAARNMQMELLPGPAEVDYLRRCYGLTVTSHFETSSDLGGDIWGAWPLDRHRVALSIADFSGHGVIAAFNTFRLHTLMQELEPARDDPAAYLGELNRRLAGLLPTGHYATMLYGVIDLQAGSFTYSAAAAPRPVIAPLAGGGLEFGDGSGLPLGVAKTARYATRWMAFKPGAALFLYSDALAECPDSQGRHLGKDGVLDLVRLGIGAMGREITADGVLGPFLQAAARPLRDDLTAVCCVRP